MTFATLDNRKANQDKWGGVKTITAVIIDRINEYREDRKELRNLYSYHSEQAAKLEQAQRDANKVWQGHHCL